MAATRRAFPWDEAIGFGFAVLRLSPSQFWSMTPRELAFAMMPFRTLPHAPSRTELDELLRQFPDKEDRP